MLVKQDAAPPLSCPHLPPFDCTSAMRLSIQPTSYGAENSAGSPIADHRRRPNRSLKPAIGFHAESGRASMPSANSPFHGKFFNLTVRMKSGELRPSIESKP